MCSSLKKLLKLQQILFLVLNYRLFLWFLKCYGHFFEVRTRSEMRTWVRGPDPGPDWPDSVRTGSGLLDFEKLGSGPGPDLDLHGSGLFEKMRTFAIPG